MWTKLCGHKAKGKSSIDTVHKEHKIKILHLEQAIHIYGCFFSSFLYKVLFRMHNYTTIYSTLCMNVTFLVPLLERGLAE